MKWYTEEAKFLRALPHATALLHLRDVLQKEGSRLPVYQFVLTDLIDQFPMLEISYDASASQVTKIGWQINPSEALRHGAAIRFPKPMTTEEAKSWTEKEQEKIKKDLLPILNRQVERTTTAIRLAIEQKRKVAYHTRLIIDDAGNKMTINEFITLLESRTDSLERLVTEAEKRILNPATTSSIP